MAISKSPASPIRFDCHGCGQPWFAPPGRGCPRCGNEPADYDPRLYLLSEVEPYPFYISCQLKDEDRFLRIVQDSGISLFLDVAGDPECHYVYRPDLAVYVANNAVPRIVTDVEDSGKPIPFSAFNTALAAAHQALSERRKLLFFCSAGLRRSPHLVYGVLRALGHSPEGSWWMVHTARPFVVRDEVYIDSAESWIQSLTPSHALYHTSDS